MNARSSRTSSGSIRVALDDCGRGAAARGAMTMGTLANARLTSAARIVSAHFTTRTRRSLSWLKLSPKGQAACLFERQGNRPRAALTGPVTGECGSRPESYCFPCFAAHARLPPNQLLASQTAVRAAPTIGMHVVRSAGVWVSQSTSGRAGPCLAYAVVQPRGVWPQSAHAGPRPETPFARPAVRGRRGRCAELPGTDATDLRLDWQWSASSTTPDYGTASLPRGSQLVE